jgi:hypothetical protein
LTANLRQPQGQAISTQKNTRHSTKAVTGSRTADTNMSAVFIYQIGNIPFPLQMNSQTIDAAI